MSDTEDHTLGLPASIYRVRVAGRLPADRQDRLGCLRGVHEEASGQSTQASLVGTVKDQPDCIGVLNTPHELRLPLLLVEALELESIPPTRAGDSSCASAPTARNRKSSTGALSLITSILGSALMMMASAGAAPDEDAREKAAAQELKYRAAEHLLDGTSFEYFYQTGGGLKIAFAAGKLQYEWISGPRKGNKAEGIPYQSRKIGKELFVVNWQEKDKPDFVTLVINLEQNVMYSSAILRYGTKEEMIHFNGAIIERVRRSKNP